MKHEVHDIPPAPRTVRLHVLLAHRWPMLLGGGLLSIGGLLLAWLMFLQVGGKPSDQARLAAGPTAQALGKVTRIEPAFVRDGTRWQRVHYEFAAAAQRWPGASFGAAERHALNAAVTIEYLPQAPHLSRIVGDFLYLPVLWCEPIFWLGYAVVPGLLCLLGWATGVFRLRHVAVHGDVSLGTLTDVQPVPLVVPQMLKVSYRFRDHQAVPRTGSHWVRRHSELGMRLLRAHAAYPHDHEPFPVLHDRAMPHWNRILLPCTFLPVRERASASSPTAS